MPHKIFFILSLIFFSFNSATAAVYKWVDDKGNVHYSEQRPLDNSAEKLRIDKAPPPSSSSYKKPSLKTKEDDKNKSDETKTADNDNNGMSAKEKQDQCDQARKDLALMESTGRLRVKDKDGNVSYMSEEDKAARIKRNQDRIKQYCQ